MSIHPQDREYPRPRRGTFHIQLASEQYAVRTLLLRQGNVFTQVCASFCSVGAGGVSVRASLLSGKPYWGTHAVRILLECILVMCVENQTTGRLNRTPGGSKQRCRLLLLLASTSKGVWDMRPFSAQYSLGYQGKWHAHKIDQIGDFIGADLLINPPT